MTNSADKGGDGLPEPSDAEQQNSGQQSGQHKNDLYGDIAARSESDEGVAAPIPAATVVLLRDTPDGPELLMLRKNSKITFGGMWVFPGGKVDAADYPADGDVDAAARTAAARETQEEAGLALASADFVHFSHWTPPPGPQKRFATWFFAAKAPDGVEIAIDDGEIKDSAWLRPTQALARHAEGEIDLAPPTWVTLFHLSQHETVSAVLDHLAAQPSKTYQTRVAKSAQGHRVAMWRGDAGYADWDADQTGPRHRLVMAESGFSFENTSEVY